MSRRIVLILFVASLRTACMQAPPTGAIIRPGASPQNTPTAPVSKAAEATKPLSPLPKIVASERDTPLQLGDQTYHFRQRVQRIEASGDETTEWWELRDSTGGVVYKQSYQITLTETGFDWTTAVSASAFDTKSGKGVLVQGLDLPSAPGTGTWVQVFGFKWGPTKATTITPFGPPISIEGEFLEIATDQRRQAPVMPGRTVIALNDILRFRVWTGNFSIVYPVLINWITGKLEPSWRCIRTTSRGRVDRCDYPIQVEPSARSERSFVRLFPEPDEGFMPKHVVIELTSKVEFLEAEVPITWSEDAKNISFGVPQNGDAWVKVRIDGVEGWIHTQEDFDAIGLPLSG